MYFIWCVANICTITVFIYDLYDSICIYNGHVMMDYILPPVFFCTVLGDMGSFFLEVFMFY